jgi:uncharacterized protein (DUF4415 family)
MNENASKNTSQTDWERVDALNDDEIDTSDIPPLDDDFFSNAELRMPEPKQAITILVDKEVLDWFKSQGKGYQTRMNAVLRMYVEGQSS